MRSRRARARAGRGRLWRPARARGRPRGAPRASVTASPGWPDAPSRKPSHSAPRSTRPGRGPSRASAATRACRGRATGGRPRRGMPPAPAPGRALLERGHDRLGPRPQGQGGHGLDPRGHQLARPGRGRRWCAAALGEPADQLIELEPTVAAGCADVGHAARGGPGAQQRGADPQQPRGGRTDKSWGPARHVCPRAAAPFGRPRRPTVSANSGASHCREWEE